MSTSKFYLGPNVRAGLRRRLREALERNGEGMGNIVWKKRPLDEIDIDWFCATEKVSVPYQ